MVDRNTTIRASQLRNFTISAEDIKINSITGDKFVDVTVSGAKIADNAISEPKLDISNSPVDGYYLKYTTASGMVWFAGGGGVSDHGTLTGLTDDDHTQYLLNDGTRQLTGNWNIGNFKLGINTVPTSPLHLSYSPGDEAAKAAYIYMAPSGTGTAGRTHTGLDITISSTHDQDTYYANLYGINLSTTIQAAGQYNSVAGVYSFFANNGVGTLNSGQGAYFSFQNSSTGTVATANGVQSLVLQNGAGQITTANGNYSGITVQNAGGQINAANGYNAYLNQQSGSALVGTLFRGEYFGTWTTKWGLYLSGEDKSYFSGIVGIGQSNPTSPLHLDTSPGDESLNQIYSAVNPTGTHTAQRTIIGYRTVINCAASDGGYNSSLRGVESYVYSSGDIHTLYGAFFYTHYNNAATNSVVSGLKATAYMGAGSSAAIYGLQGSINLGGTAGATAAYGLYGDVSMGGSETLSTANGCKVSIGQSAGTITTGYLFQGSYSGTVGTKWGIYLSGETKSYFSGQVGIKELSPAADFDINGTLILENGTSINEFSIDGALVGDSDDAVPTEKAVKTYIDSATGISSGCHVYRDSAQSIPNTTWTKVEFDAEVYDNQSEYDAVTNYRFTAKIAGTYMVSSTVAILTTVNARRCFISIYKNGTEFFRGGDWVVGGIGYEGSAIANAPAKLEVGDYVEIWAYHDFQAAKNTDTGTSKCAMIVQKITAASEHGSAHENSSYVKVSDVKSAGTAGGTFTQDAWQTRILNTEDNDPDAVCSLSSNQITLAAGTYECNIICPGARVGHHQTRLRNVTGAATLLLGNSAYEDSAAYSSQNYSIIRGRFTIAASQAIEVQHYCDTTRASDGFGIPANLGVDEVYTVAEFWKISEDGSGSGPGFSSRVSAYLGTNQTGVVTSTWTKVELNTEQFDGLGEFDSTTNYRFVANTAGYYHVCGTIGFEGMGDNDSIATGIYVDGLRVAHVTTKLGGGSSPGQNLSKLVYLAANSYVELWGRHTLGVNAQFDAGIAETYLTIHRLS